MRARLVDPLGPRWRRVLPGRPLPARRVDVELDAGSLAFRDGSFVRRIRARDLLGASTARTSDGVAVSLVTPWRNGRPVTLEVADDAEAAEIRRALGIGLHGFGEIGMPGDPVPLSRVDWTLLAVAAVAGAFMLSGLVISLAAAAMPIRLSMLSPLSIAVVAYATGALLEARRRSLGGAVVLSESAVTIQRARDHVRVSHADIRDVHADARGLRFALEDGDEIVVRARAEGWTRSRATRDELEILAAQIVAAARRARGPGDAPPAYPLRVADLAKTEDDARAWLSRLDATAASLAGDGGYRGAAFDEADLWKTVDSADAPPELRAAAARVLVRAGGTDARTKLDEILPRVRVADDERRIRIALDDDTERAAEAWTDFETHQRPRAG